MLGKRIDILIGSVLGLSLCVMVSLNDWSAIGHVTFQNLLGLIPIIVTNSNEGSCCQYVLRRLLNCGIVYASIGALLTSLVAWLWRLLRGKLEHYVNKSIIYAIECFGSILAGVACCYLATIVLVKRDSSFATIGFLQDPLRIARYAAYGLAFACIVRQKPHRVLGFFALGTFFITETQLGVFASALISRI